MLYLQSITDSEEDQPAVVSSSELCVLVVLNSLPLGGRLLFQLNVVHLPSRVLLLLAFCRAGFKGAQGEVDK